jgi:hypothetical protein
MTGSFRIPFVSDSILARLVLYYAVLYGIGWSAWNAVPLPVRDYLARNLGPVMGEARITKDLTAPVSAAVISDSGHGMAMLAILVGISAILLALPMAWVYMHTRQKKGYQQSVVHTIVLLPSVVAAVSLLVRNNIGLAFSLAGIVAAVRFRTTLDDSKDAVFIFAVSALGLACGVHLEFAAALSLVFSCIALGLWYTDFGRTPPGLEDARAEQRLQRAVQIANRTSQFVARIDREILEGMAPAQLEALSQRVKKRKTEVADAGTEKWDATMMVVINNDAGRPAVEKILTERSKKFEFARAEFLPNGTRLTYQVRARRAIPVADLATFVENDAGEFVTSVEVNET